MATFVQKPFDWNIGKHFPSSCKNLQIPKVKGFFSTRKGDIVNITGTITRGAPELVGKLPETEAGKFDLWSNNGKCLDQNEDHDLLMFVFE